MSTKKKKDGFFAIDRDRWAEVCDIGKISVAAAYLVLCRGSGGDNATTSWSANAIEKYTSISRSRARKALDDLLGHGYIEKVRGGTKPRYNLRDGREKLVDAETIWIPNALVTGTKKGETPPVERVRQTGDVMTLRLLVDLYHQQNLIEEGGIGRTTFYLKYERQELGRFAQYRLYWFGAGAKYVVWNRTTEPHMLEPEDIEPNGSCATAFFRRFKVLTALGLVQVVPHLFESEHDDAEIIHSLGRYEPLEREITEAAVDATISMYERLKGGKDYSFFKDSNSLFAPIPDHLENVTVIGVARLRYRPQTAMTSAWWSTLNDRGRRYLKQYQNMVKAIDSIDFSEGVATSR